MCLMCFHWLLTINITDHESYLHAQTYTEARNTSQHNVQFVMVDRKCTVQWTVWILYLYMYCIEFCYNHKSFYMEHATCTCTWIIECMNNAWCMTAWHDWTMEALNVNLFLWCTSMFIDNSIVVNNAKGNVIHSVNPKSIQKLHVNKRTLFVQLDCLCNMVVVYTHVCLLRQLLTILGVAIILNVFFYLKLWLHKVMCSFKMSMECILLYSLLDLIY